MADELALAHRERTALLANLCAQPPRQRLQPLAARDAPRHRLNFRIARLGPRVAHVVGDRAGEEEGELRHDAQLAAILREVERADVASVEEQLAALELVETRDQLAQRRLARAGVADDSHALPGGDRQAEVAQHPLLLSVGEVELAELDAPGETVYRLVRALLDARLGVDQGEDALAGG